MLSRRRAALRRAPAVVRPAGPPRPRAKRLALIYDARLAYDVKVMSGVAAYLREEPGYSVFLDDSALRHGHLPDLRGWQGDGVIADLNDPAIVRAVRRTRLPVVGFGAAWNAASSSIPYFYANNARVAELAADHLIDRGLAHIAYCGYAGHPLTAWSLERERAFVARVARHGLTATTFHEPARRTRSSPRADRTLEAWLRGLARPVGIMAANDALGRRVLEACRAAGLQVPYDVAVIGVDNDELICGLSSPPLTSVEQGARQLGYAAASLLGRMLSGEKLARREHVIDPIGVVARQSTHVFAVDEPVVAKAMTFIYAHVSRPTSVADVAAAAGVSRSTLEGRFRATLRRPVGVVMRRVQIEHARRLLTDTAAPIKQVAFESGFRSVQHMTTAYAKAYGQTPGRHRRMLAL